MPMIMPGSSEKAVAAIFARACEKLFVLEDLHNIGSHYDRTLTNWFANFDRNWPALQQD